MVCTLFPNQHPHQADLLQEMEKKNLENKLGEIREERQRVRDMENKCDEVALEKARVALRHREQLDIIQAAHRDLLEAQVLLIEAKSDVAGLKERNADIVKKLEEEGRAVEQLGRELEECKLKARELLGKIEQLTDDAQRKEELSSIAQNKTVEEMDEYIAAEKAKLELIHAADPGVLREFENRAQQIDRLRKQKAEKEQELEGIADKIRRIRERWEPMLDDLVSKINDAFSYNFEQINCAGEVGVHKDEDFDKWAIEIKVKFRYVTTPYFCISSPTRALTHDTQRERDAAKARPAPAVGRRACSVDHLLPHVAAVDGAGAVPRRRRDQPGHGPAQRAHGARAHGRDRLPRAHQPVLPHHAQAAVRPALRRAHEGPLHRQRPAHAARGLQAGLCAVRQDPAEADGRCWGVRGVGLFGQTSFTKGRFWIVDFACLGLGVAGL